MRWKTFYSFKFLGLVESPAILPCALIHIFVHICIGAVRALSSGPAGTEIKSSVSNSYMQNSHRVGSCKSTVFCDWHGTALELVANSSYKGFYLSD